MKEQIHGGDVYRHPGVLDFSANMNPLGTPDFVIRAAQESLNNIANYPDIRCSRLIRKLSVYEGVPEEWIICGNGAADLIFSLVQAKKPEKALLQAPTFAEYEQALSSVGCLVEYYDSAPYDFGVGEHFLEKLREDIDIVFLCNPNNPTGFLIPPEILQKIIEVCREKQIFLVLDECFQDFVDDEKKFTAKPFLKDNPFLFILNAFTKRYAMAGLRLGYGLTADTALLARMETVTQPWNVSIPAQAAGEAALDETDFVTRGLQLVAAERRYLKKEMKEAGLTVYDSQANYIFFQGPEDLREHCLKDNILIRSCSNYPSLRDGFFRVAVKKHEDNEKLIETLKKYKEQ